MRGTCKYLADNPRKIKIKFLKYVDFNQESCPVYEIDVFELCKALSQYPHSQKNFLQNTYNASNDQYQEFMAFIQGYKKSEKKAPRNFYMPSHLEMFRSYEKLLLNEKPTPVEYIEW